MADASWPDVVQIDGTTGLTLAPLLEGIPLAFGIRELRGLDVVHVVDNGLAAELLGRTAQQTRGRTARELGMSADQARVCVDVLTRARDEERPVKLATRYETREGVRDLMCFATPLSPASHYFACAVEDVTDLRRLENAVAHGDRLRTVGTLTAALVHDMAGPATAASAYLDLAQKVLAGAKQQGAVPGDSLQDDLREASLAMQTLLQILGSVRAYAQSSLDSSLTACDVNMVVDSTLRIAAAELRNRVLVRFDRGDVPPVLANAVRLGQVLLNLVSNAARSALAREPGDHPPEVRLTTRVAEEGQVQVRVIDNGVGLPRGYQRLFEPFATHHGDVGGTGLGLFISRRIVDSFGGSLSLEDRADRAGAVATVTLQPGHVEHAYERAGT